MFTLNKNGIKTFSEGFSKVIFKEINLQLDKSLLGWMNQPP